MPTKDDNVFESIDAFLAKSMSKGTVTKHYEPSDRRIDQLQVAWNMLKKELDDSRCKYTVNFEQGPIDPTGGCINVESDCFFVTSMHWVARVIELSDSFEVMPLLSGGVRVTIGFKDLLVEVPRA